MISGNASSSQTGMSGLSIEGQDSPIAGSCPSGPPVDHYKPSGRKYSKKELNDRLAYAEAKEWSLTHKRQLSPLPLPEATERLLRQWFELVDDDGSGQLNATELEFALKASGIPADSNAILEIIKLFDFDRDGEIAWREFHNFISHEVMADKDPLGSEYVLPSGMALPLGSMIGTIRRRKIMDDVEKGGDARGFWATEGPEFLRYLLESERYAFGRDGSSREVLLRILAYKPPPSKVADPEAFERHKRRIERLKMMLMRTASGRPLDEASADAGECMPSLPKDGAPVGAAAAAASHNPKPHSSTLDGAASSLAPDGSVLHSSPSQHRGTSNDSVVRAVSVRQGEGDSGGGGSRIPKSESSRRISRAQVRFAAVLAAAEAALAEAQWEQDERPRPDEAGDGGDQSATCSSQEAGGGEEGGGQGGDGGGGGDGGPFGESAAGSVLGVEMAASIVEQMRRLEEDLEQHRLRTGSFRQRPAPAAGGVSARASHARQPVVVPFQVAVDVLQTSSCRATADGYGSSCRATADGYGSSCRATADGYGSVVSDAGGSWVASSGRRVKGQTAGNEAAGGSGSEGGWVASAGRHLPPPALLIPPATSSGDGAEAGGWAASAGRRPAPPPLRVPRDGAGGSSGADAGGDGGGGGGNSSWVASAGRRPMPGRTSLEQRPGPVSPLAGPEATRPPAAVQRDAGDVGSAAGRTGGAEAAGAVSARGCSGDAGAEAEAAPWELEVAACSPHQGRRQSLLDTVGRVGANATELGSGADAVEATATAASPTESSPQPTVLRLNSLAGERSLSTGRGPYSATLVRSARASGRAYALGSPRCTGAGEVSLSGGCGVRSENSTAAAAGGTSSAATPGADAGCGLLSPRFSQKPNTSEAASVAAARALQQRSMGAMRAASFTQPGTSQPPCSRIANGRAEASAAAAEIRRMAWGSHLSSQQQGNWLPASPPSSACASVAGSAATSIAGQAASVLSQGGPGAPLIPSSLGASSHASGIPFRRSVDMGEYGMERLSSRSSMVSTGAASVGPAATAAAAEAWLVAARPGWLPNPEVRSPLSPQGLSVSQVGSITQSQLQPQPYPQPQGGSGQVQGLASGQGAALTTGIRKPPSPPGQAQQTAECTQDRRSSVWTAVASQPPYAPAQQPSFRSSATAAPSQPRSPGDMAAAPAAAPTGAPSPPPGQGRRSFESEPRTSSGHTRSSPSSAYHGPQPTGLSTTREGGFTWMRGRLMKTCLAASLRAANESSSCSSPPLGYNQPASGAAVKSSGESSMVGEGGVSAANDHGQVRTASGGSSGRAAGGSSNVPFAGPPPQADGSRIRVGSLFGKPSSPAPKQQEARAPTGGDRASNTGEPRPGQRSQGGHKVAELRWPWPWKGDFQVVGSKGGSPQFEQQAQAQAKAKAPASGRLRASALRSS